jgi:hypothetical protein
MKELNSGKIMPGNDWIYIKMKDLEIKMSS